jgi:hypothetical protein
MAKRTSRSKRKNQKARAGRAKDHGLPAKAMEERRSRPPPRDEPRKKRPRDEDEDEDDDRTSDAGDSEAPPRSKKAPKPPISQNVVYIGAAVLIALAIGAYFWSKSSGQPQRAAPEPPAGGENAPIVLTVPPHALGSGRTLAPPPPVDDPPAEQEKETEVPPEKEKEEEKETEKPAAAPSKPPPASKPPPKPTAPKMPAPPAPKPAGDNPY